MNKAWILLPSFLWLGCIDGWAAEQVQTPGATPPVEAQITRAEPWRLFDTVGWSIEYPPNWFVILVPDETGGRGPDWVEFSSRGKYREEFVRFAVSYRALRHDERNLNSGDLLEKLLDWAKGWTSSLVSSPPTQERIAGTDVPVTSGVASIGIEETGGSESVRFGASTIRLDDAALFIYWASLGESQTEADQRFQEGSPIFQNIKESLKLKRPAQSQN